MTNEITTAEQPAKLMLFDAMAERYSLRTDEFVATVRAVCGMQKASEPELAAFLIVARNYNLNPILKEIYAYPAKGGGIVPIVSVDGWLNVINSHPQCNGFTFAFEHDNANNLLACTCTIHRKDRAHPVVVTEYLAECVRTTDPWKMKHRMLRHKALIQAARYAFGFAGIYDEDEGRQIAEAGASFAEPRDITPERTPVDPTAPRNAVDPAVVTIDVKATEQSSSDAGQTFPGSSRSEDAGGEGVQARARDSSPPDPDAHTQADDGPAVSEILHHLDVALGKAKTVEDVEDIYSAQDIDATLASTEDGVANARKIKARHRERIEAEMAERQTAIDEQKRQNEEKAARRARRPQEKESAEKAAKPEPEQDPIQAFAAGTLAAVRKMIAGGAKWEEIRAYWQDLSVRRTELGMKPAQTNALKAEVTALANGEKE